MSLYFAKGAPDANLDEQTLRGALATVLEKLGELQRVIAVPPDYSRYSSQAGRLTEYCWEVLGDRLVDVMPALGTHKPMTDEQRSKMFGSIPPELFRCHRWRTDVETIDTVPADYVADVTEGIYKKPWPAQLNRQIAHGGHDLILSLGQVVPHEVIGMANYNKNLFVGTGGVRGINESHYIGAVYGMERIMGRGDTPLRRILNYAQDNFCAHLPILYVLTVIGPDEQGASVMRGLFIGDDVECFERACELSSQVNITHLDHRLDKVVVRLDPKKFESTWLGNKAIYRTRMAIADDGELIILAPGVREFGEDEAIDALIREFGYRSTPEILEYVDRQPALQENLSAAAHLIHGSSEGRFRITYCPGGLTQKEIEGVGYGYGDLKEYASQYEVDTAVAGPQVTADGEPYYYIADPAMGLWSA